MLAIGFLLLHGGRGGWIRTRSLPFGIAVAALVGLNPLFYIIGTQITYPAVGMLLVIVGVGALLHDWFWATVVILALDVAWILCAVAYGIPVPPAIFAAQMLKANALAIVLNVARTRTVRRFEQARLEVHRLATTDELTGLANQRGLMEVARELEATGRTRTHHLAVVYVDVDGLKSVNDAHGHAAGDALIRSVADVLRRAFRPVDTIARVGGDEFAVLVGRTRSGCAGRPGARPPRGGRSVGQHRHRRRRSRVTDDRRRRPAGPGRRRDVRGQGRQEERRRFLAESDLPHPTGGCVSRRLRQWYRYRQCPSGACGTAC